MNLWFSQNSVSILISCENVSFKRMNLLHCMSDQFIIYPQIYLFSLSVSSSAVLSYSLHAWFPSPPPVALPVTSSKNIWNWATRCSQSVQNSEHKKCVSLYHYLPRAVRQTGRQTDRQHTAPPPPTAPSVKSPTFMWIPLRPQACLTGIAKGELWDGGDWKGSDRGGCLGFDRKEWEDRGKPQAWQLYSVIGDLTEVRTRSLSKIFTTWSS